MTSDDWILLNEEIAGMARAGLPLDQGLTALARELGRGKLQRITTTLADDLRAGRTLPEAFQRLGTDVPPYYASLLEAGIRSGRISEVLASLTSHARSLSELRSSLLNAFFYPVIVLGFSGLLFGFLCWFVLPSFDQIFKDFNMRLPTLTVAVMTVGMHPLEYVVLPLAVLLGLGFLVRLLLRRTQVGRLAWTRFVYSLPLFGTFLRAGRLATFSELLAILVEQSLPLREAFRLACQASSEPLLAAAAEKVDQALAQGQSLGVALREQRLVPELLAWMVGIGEQRGNLATALRQGADLYRRQADLRAGLLRTVFPPLVVLIASGVLVALFALAILLPLVRLLEGLSK